MWSSLHYLATTNLDEIGMGNGEEEPHCARSSAAAATAASTSTDFRLEATSFTAATNSSFHKTSDFISVFCASHLSLAHKCACRTLDFGFLIFKLNFSRRLLLSQHFQVFRSRKVFPPNLFYWLGPTIFDIIYKLHLEVVGVSTGTIFFFFIFANC